MAAAGAETTDVGESESVETWLARIDLANKDMDPWVRRCKKIRNKYRYEGSEKSRRRRYQLLWSNQQIMRPSVYAKRPSPVVQNRWKDGDAVARILCELLERNLDFQFDMGDFDQTLKQVRDDYLLYARGVPRLRYEPVFDEGVDDGLDGEDAGGPDDAAKEAPATEAIDEAGDAAPVAEPPVTIQFENIRLDFVQRDDLVHPKCRVWTELPWLALRSFLTREELTTRWPDIGSEIALDTNADGDDDKTNGRQDTAESKATIWEIWDKAGGQVLWLAKGHPDVLEQCEPYLKFDGFYPIPRPAYGTLTTDSLEPIPDFVYYQDQAEEIDDLTARIASLSDSLKLVGFYPAGPDGEGSPEIEAAVKPGVENKMIAVKSWAAFQANGKGQAPIVFLPVEQVGTILKGCVELRKQLVDDVYQITGISDIIRGDTDAEETAAAQGIKAQWGSFRLRERQKELARVARDVTRMAGEIIANHFQVATLCKTANMKIPTDADAAQNKQNFDQAMAQYRQMVASHSAAPGAAPGGPGAPAPAQPGQPPQPSPAGPPGGAPQPGHAGPPGMPPPPQFKDLGPTQEMVQALMRDNVTQRFLIDIEVDSTIAADENMEKKARTEFLEAVSKFVVGWMPIIQASPELIPLAGQMLLFAVRAFPIGRELEEVIEQAMDKLGQAAGQPKPPNPEQLKAQSDMAKNQAEIEKSKIDLQAVQLKAQSDTQRAQIDAQTAVQEHQMALQKMQLQHTSEMQQMRSETANKHQTSMLDHTANMQQIRAQGDLDQQKQAAAQKTLAQTADMAEKKMIAKQSLATFGEQGGLVKEPKAEKPEAPPPAPAKRNFQVTRDAGGRLSGLQEL